MSMSGIKVDSAAVSLYSDIKLKKIHKFALFKLSDDGKKVVTDILGDPVKTETAEEDEEQWEKMKGCLKLEEPSFAVYDFRFKRNDGRLCEKIAFISWSDDGKCNMKKKMVFAATKDTVKKAFEGFQLEIQANEMADLDYSAWKPKVEKA